MSLFRRIECIAVFAWVAASVACESPPANQPNTSPGFVAAMREVCDVDRLAQLDPAGNSIAVEGAREDWMNEHVKDPDAIELLTLMRVEGPKRRAEMLRQALEGSANRNCALADYYEANP
ncbi:MAG TPA: hypothetical protein VHM70_03290 [Polyangiaceae bacterium]|jgi:hypothetical protein|nr:hypothetical protein [Polyangiaceae bacterium]